MLLHYAEQLPPLVLAPFVFSFWKTQNTSGSSQSYLILPDAGVELLFTCYPVQPARATLSGLATQPIAVVLPPEAVLFGIRFKLLAVEYVLHTTLPLNTVRPLPADWPVRVQAELPLASFAAASSDWLTPLVSSLPIDPRKHQLFDQLYAAQGAVSVQHLTREAGWTARQVNRYFTATFGLGLKRYLQQLAFGAALAPLRQGQRQPPLTYHDQSHFIRHVRQPTGHTPTQLYERRHTRYAQLAPELLPERPEN